MNDHQHTPAKIQNFSLAFQQMCSIVAIGQTKSQDETLRELILQTLVLLPDEKISNEHDFSQILSSLFGLQIANHEIKFAIDRLIAEKSLVFSSTGLYVLAEPIAASLKSEIENEIALESKVRDGWLEDLKNKYPDLPFAQSWTALRNYLAGAFLRHGIQAVALLDSSIELDHIHQQSLTELLQYVVSDFSDENKLDAKRAISDFVAASGTYLERSKYIAQLADGAFSYFSLATDPKVADRLRQNLNPLMLFLDTNFLFGILGLTSNPQVAVSNELLRTIQKYTFPFTLKRHSRTEDELINSVSTYEAEFLQRHWSKSISRAAMRSRLLSGVEIKYHQAFIEKGVDVQSFFRPYHHADILLNEKSIELFEEIEPDENTQKRIATLIADYEDFLRARGKDKSYRTIHHDMAVLDVVRQFRSNARSTLDAGALIITCDYNLYGFDWETSKRQGIQPCTVLPNLFWQILHPFIPSDENFSQAFAQTFAIPEFRTISSGAAEACSKMVSMMAGYEDFPEETAERMLSNDILIDQLRKAQDDEEFQSFVEAAIVNENAQLLGEKMILTQKYEVEKSEKDELFRRLEETTDLVKQKETRFKTEYEQRIRAEKVAEEERENRAKAELDAINEKEDRQKAVDKLNRVMVIGKAVLFGIFSVVAFEILIHVIPWYWLTTHPESYGLQACFDLILIGVGFAIFVKQWRKSTSILLLLPLGLLLIQLLGGPK